eukprot:6406072-Prorocentrum_lima.AAC.1
MDHNRFSESFPQCPNLQGQDHFGCSAKHIGKAWNCGSRSSMEDSQGSLWTQGKSRLWHEERDE